MDKLFNRRISLLSGGQRQRVYIARVFLGKSCKNAFFG